MSTEFCSGKRNNLLWLRAETKAFEQRTLLTPEAARQLLGNGYEVVVERSAQRIFEDEAYANAGCRMVDTHAWHQAPEQAIILGLKELDPADGPFARRHVHFAHVFKDQQDWQITLRQHQCGGGILYDLEYLTDVSGKRIAAFGYWAGYVGAALSVLGYCAKSSGHVLNALTAWEDKEALLASVKSGLSNVRKKPNAMVIGALGRCGAGAVELLTACNLEISAWDQMETASGGPFDAILDHDIFINCVFVNSPLSPFITHHQLTNRTRRLQVISDVSCDPHGQYNPVPIYNKCTTMDKPVDEIVAASQECASLELIAIDHLPSLLPRESSEHFANQLLPTLLELRNPDSGVWKRAESVYRHHLTRLSAGDKS
ncbi:MAG: saccharopine dehydrogenase [Granulosicoccus sp.]